MEWHMFVFVSVFVLIRAYHYCSLSRDCICLQASGRIQCSARMLVDMPDLPHKRLSRDYYLIDLSHNQIRWVPINVLRDYVIVDLRRNPLDCSVIYPRNILTDCPVPTENFEGGTTTGGFKSYTDTVTTDTLPEMHKSRAQKERKSAELALDNNAEWHWILGTSVVMMVIVTVSCLYFLIRTLKNCHWEELVINNMRLVTMEKGDEDNQEEEEEEDELTIYERPMTTPRAEEELGEAGEPSTSHQGNKNERKKKIHLPAPEGAPSMCTRSKIPTTQL